METSSRFDIKIFICYKTAGLLNPRNNFTNRNFMISRPGLFLPGNLPP